MQRRCALAALLALAVGCASGQRDDAVSLLQSSAQGALQPARGWHIHHGGGEEDTRSQTFVVGEVAEMRSQRFESVNYGWIVCTVSAIGREPNTYDLIIPGTAVLKGVPALMMRKKRKSGTTTTPEPMLGKVIKGGIDGDPGELVEVFSRKSGSWVPGVIRGLGGTPDSFNVQVTAKDGTSRLLRDVPGPNLRKKRITTTLAPSELAAITYKVGDRVDLLKSGGDPSEDGDWIQAVITAPGKSPDTWTVYVNLIGYEPDVPKVALRHTKQEVLEHGPSSTLIKEPELSDDMYKVGENVESKIMAGGQLSGFWLKAKIAALGETAWTYYINYTEWKLQDMVMIPTYHEMLRRPNSTFRRAALTSFEPGEPVEFKTIAELRKTADHRWFNATVVGLGQAGDTYDIRKANGEIVPSFPAELLRKTYLNESWLPKTPSLIYFPGEDIEYKNFFSGLWNKGRIIGESDVKGTYELDAVPDMINPAVRVLHQMPPEMIRRPAKSFIEGDAVEVEGTKRNEFNDTYWYRGVVSAVGPKEDMYEVFVQDSSAAGIVKGVRFKKMKQVNPIPPKFLMKAYEPSETVEMKVLYGSGAGNWVPVKIASRGSVLYSYNVTVAGLGLTPNVPIELLRKVPSSSYKVGEFARVRVAYGPTVGQWMEALVSGHGTMPDTFNISYWGIGLVPNIPIQLMQKINKPARLEDQPYFEVGSSVKVRILVGPEIGNWISGMIKKQSVIINSTDGPRPQLYSLSLPEYPEIGDLKDIPVDLLVKDEFAMRPLAVYIDLKVNDTVLLKGFVGQGGAPWVKVLAVKNGTRRDTYDIHLPGAGIFNDIPIELLRHVGDISPIPEFQVDQEVEMKDIFDLGSDNKLWVPCKIRRPGRRTNTYDCGIDNTTILFESVPGEILRRADGQQPQKFWKTYYPGELIETKDVLGVIASNATSKVVFRVVGEGTLKNTYDITGPIIGLITDVPVVLLKKISPQEIERLDSTIDVGDYVECSDIDKAGSRTICYVEGPGNRPDTWNVRMPNINGVFPNIPAARLRKKPVERVEEATTPAPTSGLKEMQVGDAVEVFDKRRKEEPWVQGVIIGKGTERRTFDVKIGDLQVFRNVPSDKLRRAGSEQEEEEEQLATTTTTTTASTEPLGIADAVFYVGPDSNLSDPNTWEPMTILKYGQAPNSFDLGTKSGFVMQNILAKYIYRDMRYVSTTPDPEQVFAYNVKSTLNLVMPTIKTFQETFRHQENEHLKEELGDTKYAFQNEYSGKNLGDGSVQFEVGEKAEVQIARGEYKGAWVQCVISGLGKFRNSYDIHLPGGKEGFKDILNVGAKVLRKVGLVNDPESDRIRASSPCTEDERMGVERVLSLEGISHNNPEECTKVVGVFGVNSDNAGICAMKKFAISAQCSQCAVDFSKEAAGASLLKKNCAMKCVPAMQACGDSSGDPASCMTTLPECLSCVKTPLTNFLKCFGAADSTTASKIEQLTEAATSGTIMAGVGVVEGIFGQGWVSSHALILKPFLGNLVHSEDTPTPEPRAVDGGRSLTVFEVGDQAEIKIQKGSYAGQWVECHIIGKGQVPNTYNVHVPTAPEGRQDFPDVRASILRKSELTDDDPTAPTPEQMAEDPL